MEQQDLNKRLLLALVLSMFVFIGYGYLFPATGTAQQKEVTNEKTLPIEHKTPTNVSSNNSAPTPMKKTVSKNAPSQTISTILTTVHAKHFTMSIDEFGRIVQVELLEDKYKDEEGNTLKLFEDSQVKPLELRFADSKLNDEAFKVPYTTNIKSIDLSSNSNTVKLTQQLSALTVTKTITVMPTGEYSVDIETSAPSQFFVTPGHRPVADKSMYMLVRGVLIKGADDIITTIEDGDAEGYEKFQNAKIVSAFDRYVASIFFNLNKGLDVSILKEANSDPLAFVEGSSKLHFGAYIGPKENNILKSIDPELTDAIEFGWFSFLAKPFYKVLLWINSYVGNWGWAIILFTLLVKLILFPLSYKGMMSMQKLKDLAPKMKEMKEKYKGDPAKMNVKMMEMYKKEGANPMGGCLPMLLQIPVFFALYRVLLNADELQGAHWIQGWIDNLAVMDPYYILPILMGASMWFQQRITPTTMQDPLQEKIFKFFPVIMTVFFIYFPAGLVLYWLVNSLFTIAQQYFINKMYTKHKEMASSSNK